MFWFDYHWQIQAVLNNFWWPINFVLIGLLLLTAWLGYKKPEIAAAITLACLPLYLVRSQFWFLPVTYLELSIWATFIGWIVGVAYKKHFIGGLKPYRGAMLVFLVASIIGLLLAPDMRAAAGLWKAYVIEPLMLFIVIRSVIVSRHDNRNILLWGLTVAAATIGLLAVYQKFTGFGINVPSWVNPDHRRVTSFFTSPNAVGLFLAPVMLITIGWLMSTWRNWRGAIVKLLLIILYAIAIIFTVSQGTWIGVAAGLVTLLFFGWNKYITSGLVIVAIAITFLTPAIRTALAPYALFKDVAGQNRIELWDLSWDTLTEGPKNFTFGIGLFGFAKLHDEVRDPLHIEPLLYPHNILFNFWLEFGLLGLFAIVWLLFSLAKQSRKQLKSDKPSDRWLAAGILAAMITILVHGLVDVPYFKNDLAVLWWVVIGLVI